MRQSVCYWHIRQNLCSDSQSPSQSTGRVLVVHSWCPLMGFSPSGPRVTNPKSHLSTFCFVCHHSARRLSHRRVLPVCFFPLLDFSRAASRVQRVKLSRPLAPIHRPGAPFPSCRAPDGRPWWSHLLLARLSEPPEQEGTWGHAGRLQQGCRRQGRITLLRNHDLVLPSNFKIATTETKQAAQSIGASLQDSISVTTRH